MAGALDGPSRYGKAMATIELLTAAQAPLLARPYYADGDPGPIVAALAQVPELLEVGMPFISAALGPSAITFRHKEIVIVRTSALQGCSYCVATHTPVALDAGLTHDEIRALRGEADLVIFTDPRERALLRWVDAVAGASGPVPDDVRRELRTHWADHEIVDLTVCSGATMMLNRLATGLELPVSGGTAQRLVEEGFA